jgi:hypothetical protein
VITQDRERRKASLERPEHNANNFAAQPRRETAPLVDPLFLQILEGAKP